MTEEDDLRTALLQFGIHAVIQPGEISRPEMEQVDALLIRGNAQQRYTVALNRPGRLDEITRLHLSGRPALLFTDVITSRTATALRNAGVHYADRAGNAWIEFADVLIDIRGRTRPRLLVEPASWEIAKPAPRVVASNIFSAARSQVVFALLAWPELWTSPRRDLAEAAGVSVGLAHDTLTGLRETSLDRDELRPALPGLLDRWAVAFPGTLAKRLTIAAYRGDIDSIWQVKTEGEVLISGEAAATELLGPASAVLYVQKHDASLALDNRWRTDGFANIIVRRKFWHGPGDLMQDPRQARPAPWPLVYADLSTSDDPRVRDSAAEWKDRFADAGKNGRRSLR